MCLLYDGNSRRLNRKWFYGEAGNRTCDPWFTRHSAYPLHHGGLQKLHAQKTWLSSGGAIYSYMFIRKLKKILLSKTTGVIWKKIFYTSTTTSKEWPLIHSINLLLQSRHKAFCGSVLNPNILIHQKRKGSGSVVECLTRDRGAAGSSLTSVTALCPWARHIYPSLVLVQPRKTRPCLTERLLMGRIVSNQKINNTQNIKMGCDWWVIAFWARLHSERVKNLKLLSPKPWLIFPIISVKFLKENSFVVHLR